MVRRRHPIRNDLFSIFPDLPLLRPRPRAEQLARIRRMMLDAQLRAAASAARQKSAALLVQKRFATRRGLTPIRIR